MNTYTYIYIHIYYEYVLWTYVFFVWYPRSETWDRRHRVACRRSSNVFDLESTDPEILSSTKVTKAGKFSLEKVWIETIWVTENIWKYDQYGCRFCIWWQVMSSSSWLKAKLLPSRTELNPSRCAIHLRFQYIPILLGRACGCKLFVACWEFHLWSSRPSLTVEVLICKARRLLWWIGIALGQAIGSSQWPSNGRQYRDNN